MKTSHTSRPVVRDSAGVRIVENSGSSEAPAKWSVSTEPIFRVGWSEGDTQFQLVGSGYVDADGEVRVADYGTSLVHTFSSTGVLLATVGGSGEGPGEFGQLGTVLGLGGDSLLVSDMRGRKNRSFALSTSSCWIRSRRSLS